MATKIVVIDAAYLSEGVEFPPLRADKYSWEQYRALNGEEITDRCWRTDILVSLGSALDRSILDGLHRLKLVVVAGKACAALDQIAVRDNGLEVLVFPDADCSDPVEARQLCERISTAIDHYISDLKE